MLAKFRALWRDLRQRQDACVRCRRPLTIHDYELHTPYCAACRRELSTRRGT